MRILYLSQDHGIPILGRKGCSTHVRETCSALQAAGHEVSVLCSQRGDDAELARDLRIDEVKPSRLRVLGYDLRNLCHNLPFQRAARRLVEARQIEAIYERFSLYSLTGTRLSERYGLPRIVEVNAFLTVEHRDKIHFHSLARRVEQRVVRAAPALVVVSQPLQESLVELGVDPERVFIMPMAVDISHFRPDRERGATIRRKWELGERAVVGYIGGLAGWHGTTFS